MPKPIELKKLQERYEIVSTVRGYNGKPIYTCRCKICGAITTAQTADLLVNTCTCEGNGSPWTESLLKKKLAEFYGGEYELVDKFKGINSRTLFRHSCGFIWSNTPSRLLYTKTFCPHCCRDQSKKYRLIRMGLRRRELDFEENHFVPNTPLNFGFFLTFEGKSYAIDYYGEYHYKYLSAYHGGDTAIFERYKADDAKKRAYCLSNNINYIIIPYTMSNDDTRALLANLFGGPTTTEEEQELDSSESKQCAPDSGLAAQGEDIV